MSIENTNNITDRQRNIVEGQATDSASKGSSRARRHLFRVIVTAVNTGVSPVTYDVTVLSGSADTSTSWTISDVLGTTATAQFSVGDKAMLAWHPPEPATLIAGGDSSSGNARAIFLNAYNSSEVS